MHDGNRGDHTKAGLIAGLIVALLFCVVWIGYGLSESAKYERHAYNQNREYAEYTGDKVAQTCVGISAVEKVKCLDEAFEKQREHEANQQDLVAQRQSALWAFIMGAAAVIGMGLSVIGVVLVWTTFEATRKANKIAMDTFELASKPWLIPRIEGDYLQLNKTNFDKQVGNVRSIHARVWVENYGEMPATVISSEIFLVGGEPSEREPRPTFHVLTKGGAFSIGEDQRMFEASRSVSVLKERHPEIGRFIITPEFAKGGFHDPPKIVCRIEYLDPAGNTRELGFAFRPSAAWTNDFKRWGGEQYNYDRKLRAPQDK